MGLLLGEEGDVVAAEDFAGGLDAEGWREDGDGGLLGGFGGVVVEDDRWNLAEMGLGRGGEGGLSPRRADRRQR